MALQIWVAQLPISSRTAQKIVERHQIEPAEVVDAVVGVAGLSFRYHRDEARGERAIEVAIRGRTALLVLYDAQHPLGDVWHLGSAYFV